MTCVSCTKAGRCVDPPTPEGPDTVEHLPCWECDGVGCEACLMSGKLTLRACPCTFLDSTTTQAMKMAQWAERGFLPEPGAKNDQREIDVHTIELIWSEMARCQNDLAAGKDEA